MNAIQLLTQDHDAVRELFKEFNGGGGLTGVVRRTIGSVSAEERRSAVQKVCQELELHTLIEEEAFYPAVQSLGDHDLNAMVTEALKEHGTVKEEVSRLRAARGDEGDVDDRMAQLEKDVEHHAGEEEDEMFPRLEELMTEAQLEDLGRRLASLKSTIATSSSRGGAPAGKSRRGTQSGASSKPRKTAQTGSGRR